MLLTYLAGVSSRRDAGLLLLRRREGHVQGGGPATGDMHRGEVQGREGEKDAWVVWYWDCGWARRLGTQTSS